MNWRFDNQDRYRNPVDLDDDDDEDATAVQLCEYCGELLDVCRCTTGDDDGDMPAAAGVTTTGEGEGE